MGEWVVAGNFFQGEGSGKRGKEGERKVVFPLIPLTSPSFPFVVSFRSSSRVERVAVRSVNLGQKAICRQTRLSD